MCMLQARYAAADLRDLFFFQRTQAVKPDWDYSYVRIQRTRQDNATVRNCPCDRRDTRTYRGSRTGRFAKGTSATSGTPPHASTTGMVVN